MANKSVSVLDRYDQFAVNLVSATVAATGGVVQQLVTGLSNIQKTAWAVSRIEYWPIMTTFTNEFTTGAHYIRFGWQQSSSVGGIANPELYTFVLDDKVIRSHWTKGAGDSVLEFPLVTDFGDNPMLFLPTNLWSYFVWNTAINLSSSYGVHTRIWYKEIELGPEDWYDLLQMRLPLGAI